MTSGKESTMPRPKKCRKICSLPGNDSFGPIGGVGKQGETVVMALDEYETIRIIDLLGLTQEECAEQMGVARTTVQAVYNSARRKLADVLVNGKELCIRGGDYVLCGESAGCCGKNCGRRQCGRRCCREGGEEISCPLKCKDAYDVNVNEED